MDARDGRHRLRRGGGGGVTADERRLMANVRRREERRQQRDNLHRANRGQEPAPNPAPAPAPAAPAPAAVQPGETRRDQLRRWLAEREAQKALEKARRAREPGVFRPAGAVHHKVSEFRHMPAVTRNATAPAPEPAPAGQHVAQPSAAAQPRAVAGARAPAQRAPAGRVAAAAAPAAQRQPAAPAAGRRVTRSMARPAAAAAAATATLHRASPARGRAAATRGIRARAAPPRAATAAAAAAMASVAPRASARAATAAPTEPQPDSAGRRGRSARAPPSPPPAEPLPTSAGRRGRAARAQQSPPPQTPPAPQPESPQPQTPPQPHIPQSQTPPQSPPVSKPAAKKEAVEKTATQQPEHPERLRGVSFAPEQHQFRAPEGVTSHVFRTPVRTVRPSYRKTPLHAPPPSSSDSGTDSDSVGTPASCIASAIAEFRHLVGSPWITMTRGSSSKKKRREDLERQRRLAASIDMDDVTTEDMSDSPASAAEPTTASSAAEPVSAAVEPVPAAVEPVPAAVAEAAPVPAAAADAKKPASTPAAKPARKAVAKATPAAKPAPEPAPSAAPVTAPSALSAAAGPELSIGYFRRLLADETDRLTSLAERWEAVAAGTGIPDETLGEMRSVTGQARLLIRERFVQFDSLVDGAEFLRGPRPTTLTDLQGFWEMIYFQVEDVDRKFAHLEELRAAGWRNKTVPAPVPAAPAPAAAAAPSERVKKPAARRPAVKKAGPSAALRAAMMAARQKLKDQPSADVISASPTVLIAAPAAPTATVPEAVKALVPTPDRAPEAASSAAAAAAAPTGMDRERRFTGGFFTVATPTVPASPAATQEGTAARHQRAEMRRSLLLSSQRPRRTSDLSPLVRVSLSAKLAQRTPAQGTPSRLAASPPAPTPTTEVKEEKEVDVDMEEQQDELPAKQQSAPKRRASRASRRSALTELSCNTPLAAGTAGSRPSVRRSRRLPSLLGEPRDSPLPAPLHGDLMSFDSPATAAAAAAGPRRKSRRLTAAEAAAC